MSAKDQPPTYERTGTGYRRADGEERRCVRFYLSPDQATALKRQVSLAQADEPDLTQSEWLSRELGLPADEGNP